MKAVWTVVAMVSSSTAVGDPLRAVLASKEAGRGLVVVTIILAPAVPGLIKLLVQVSLVVSLAA